MQKTAWTREDIRAFVAGHEVALRNADTHPKALPDWVREIVGRVWDMSAGSLMARLHPDDRDELAFLFIGSLEVPGEIVSTTVRGCEIDQWWRFDLRMVNLVGHDEIDGLLAVIEREEIEVPDDLGGGVSEHVGESQSLNWIIESLDTVGTILSIEGKVQEILGLPAEEVVGRNHLEFTHPDSHSDILLWWLETIDLPGATRLARRCIVRPDGTSIWAEYTFVNRLGPDGSGDVLGVAYDISEQRADEEALRLSHEETRRMADQHRHLAEEFRLLAEEVPAVVFRADAGGFIAFHNNRWDELTRSEVTRGHLHDVVHPPDRPLVDQALAALDIGTTDNTTFQVRAFGGEAVLSFVCRAVIDEGSGPRSIVGSIHDVTSEVVLRRRADTDALTGLLNRTSIAERVADALYDGVVDAFVVFIDLDGFKVVNDTFGHDVGDEVLKEIARRFARAVRPEDAVARYGGDEFVVFARGIDQSGEASLLGRLSQALREPVMWAGGSWSPAASMGCARPEVDDEVADVIRRADQAMFVVKHERQLRIAR